METAKENLLKLLPKIKILASKEGDSRKPVSDILKNQEVELGTYSEDEGKCLSFCLMMGLIHYWFFLTINR